MLNANDGLLASDSGTLHPQAGKMVYACLCHYALHEMNVPASVSLLGRVSHGRMSALLQEAFGRQLCLVDRSMDIWEPIPLPCWMIPPCPVWIGLMLHWLRAYVAADISTSLIPLQLVNLGRWRRARDVWIPRFVSPAVSDRSYSRWEGSLQSASPSRKLAQGWLKGYR